MKNLFKRILPVYIRLWPTYHWIAIWSAPDRSHNETDLEALRITLRRGPCHSELIRVLKGGRI